MPNYNINIVVDPSSARRGTREVERGLDRVNRSARDTNQSLDELSTGITSAVAPTREVERGLNRVNRSARGANRSLDGLSRGITNAVSPTGEVVDGLNQMLGGTRDTMAAVEDLSRSIWDVITPTHALRAAFIGIGATVLTLNLDVLKSEIISLAALAGTSVQEFQKVSTAFAAVNIEADKTADILKDVNDRVGDFIQTGGGEFVDIFEKILKPIGMTKDALKEMSSPQVLQAVATGMEKLGLNVQETTFFFEALASDASALSPLLAQNGKLIKQISQEIENKGLLLTQGEVIALKDMNSELAKAGALIKNVLTKAVGILAKNIDTLINSMQTLALFLVTILARTAFTAATTAVLAFNAALLANPIGLLIMAVAAVVAALVGFADQIKISSDGLTTLQDIGVATFEAMSSAFTNFIDIFRDDFNTITGFVADIFGDSLDEVTFSFDSMVLGAAKTVDFIIGAFGGLGRALVIVFQANSNDLKAMSITVLNDLIDLFGKGLRMVGGWINTIANKIPGMTKNFISELKIGQIEGGKGGENIANSIINAFADAIKESTLVEDALRGIRARAGEIAAERELLLDPIAVTGDRMPGGVSGSTDALKEAEAMLRSIRGPLETYMKGLTDLNTLLDANKISTDEFNVAQRDLRIAFLDTQTTMESGFERAFLKIGRDAEDFASQTENLVTKAFKGMEDALVGFVTTGKVDFKSLADSIIADFARIAIKKAIIGPLMQAFGGEGGLSSMFGFKDGGLALAMAGGGFVTGAGTSISDSIPANLSNGEFVVNARSTSRFRPELDAINSGQASVSRNNGPVVQIFDQRTNPDSNEVETKETTGVDGRKILQVMITDTMKRGVDNGVLDSSLRNRYGLKRQTAMRG